MVVHAKMLDDATLLRYSAQLPSMVLLNRTIPQISNRSVYIDNRAGAKESVAHLISQGHRKIACVTSNLPIEDRTERLNGYRDAMQKPTLLLNQTG